MTSAPIADLNFAATFSSSFNRMAAFGTLVYPNVTVANPVHKCNSTFSSWQFTAGPALAGADMDVRITIPPAFRLLEINMHLSTSLSLSKSIASSCMYADVV